MIYASYILDINMSSSISGGAPTSTPSTTNAATPITFDNFDLLKDDVRCLSFFDKKKLARHLGIKVANTSTWAEIGPMTLCRLKRWCNLATPPRDEKQKKLEEIAWRKQSHVKRAYTVDEFNACAKHGKKKVQKREPYFFRFLFSAILVLQNCLAGRIDDMIMLNTDEIKRSYEKGLIEIKLTWSKNIYNKD